MKMALPRLKTLRLTLPLRQEQRSALHTRMQDLLAVEQQLGQLEAPLLLKDDLLHT